MNRKITLLIAVFFVLAACNEDVYQEIDQQNEILQSNTGVEDTGGNQPFTVVTGAYESPWDLYTRDVIPRRVTYTFNNLTDDVATADLQGHSLHWISLL